MKRALTGIKAWNALKEQPDIFGTGKKFVLRDETKISYTMVKHWKKAKMIKPTVYGFRLEPYWL